MNTISGGKIRNWNKVIDKNVSEVEGYGENHPIKKWTHASGNKHVVIAKTPRSIVHLNDEYRIYALRSDNIASAHTIEEAEDKAVAFMREVPYGQFKNWSVIR